MTARLREEARLADRDPEPEDADQTFPDIDDEDAEDQS